MATSGKQRVAEYRARRKAEKLCVEAGCGRRVRKYVRCDEHRRAHNESAAKIRFKAFEADLARDDVDTTHRDLISTEELAGLVRRAAEVGRLSAENELLWEENAALQKSLLKALEDNLELLYPDLVPHRVFALPAPSESAGAAELIEPSPPRASQDIDQEQGRSPVRALWRWIRRSKKR